MSGLCKVEISAFMGGRGPVAGKLLFRQPQAHVIKDAGNLVLQKASRHPELSSACADDHKACILASPGWICAGNAKAGIRKAASVSGAYG